MEEIKRSYIKKLADTTRKYEFEIEELKDEIEIISIENIKLKTENQNSIHQLSNENTNNITISSEIIDLKSQLRAIQLENRNLLQENKKIEQKMEQDIQNLQNHKKMEIQDILERQNQIRSNAINKEKEFHKVELQKQKKRI